MHVRWNRRGSLARPALIEPIEVVGGWNVVDYLCLEANPEEASQGTETSPDDGKVRGSCSDLVCIGLACQDAGNLLEIAQSVQKLLVRRLVCIAR